MIDFLLGIVDWFMAKFLLPILPNEMSNLPIVEFQEHMVAIRDSLGYSFSIINKFVSVSLFFGVVITIITAELILFSFKSVKFLLNLFRGSGA